MDEYISREAVLGLIAARKRYLDDARENSSLTELSEIDGYEKALDVLKEDLQEINAADVQPVKHGRWLIKFEGEIYEFSECSECGNTESCETPYCAQCGARMDLE